MQQVQYLTVEADHQGRRLDNFLIGRFNNLPKSLLYRIIRRGEVRVNKRRVKQDYRLQTGDNIRIPPLQIASSGPPVIPQKVLDTVKQGILYLDDHVVVVNKPSGLAVHSGSGLAYGLIEVMQRLFPDRKPQLVHRLDRETSGCLLLAFNMPALMELNRQFKEREISKVYLALLHGHLETSTTVDLPLSVATKQGERHVYPNLDQGGKPSRTDFERLVSVREATLVRAHPLTGRTHQIRVHAVAMGHALLGDKRYGERGDNLRMRQQYGLRRLFLHAESVSWVHPKSHKTVMVRAPLDSELENVLLKLGTRHGDEKMKKILIKLKSGGKDVG